MGANKDIGGLEIAVHHPCAVGHFEGGEHLLQKDEDALRRCGRLVDGFGQCLPEEVLHDDEGDPIGALAAGQGVNDVRVLEAQGYGGFLHEALACHGVKVVGVGAQGLDGHRALLL